ncbi:MAG: M15 family metallopeptidase [Dehalococcoidia bacterium]
MLALATTLAVAVGGCGSGKQNSATSSRPRIEIVPSASGSAAAGLPRGSVPVTQQSGAFAAVTPAPLATCTPGDLLRLVDKDTEHALPPDYVPPDLMLLKAADASPGAAATLKLRQPAEAALEKMLGDARAAGLFPLAQSTYRSYDDQARIYQEEVKNFGEAQADRESARPGHSEHQLGTTIDFTTKSLAYDLNESFAATPEGRWLAQHAAQYGFVLSYPQGKEAQSGYVYEPWHYRYIGAEAAQSLGQSGLTLREWLSTRQVGCHA